MYFAHYQVSELKGFSRFESRKPPMADSNAGQNPYRIPHSFLRLIISLGRIEPYIEGTQVEAHCGKAAAERRIGVE